MTHDTSSQRTKVLADIRARLAHAKLRAEPGAPDTIVPQRAQKPLAERVQLFASFLQGESATVATATTAGDARSAIVNYLNGNNLPGNVRHGNDARLRDILGSAKSQDKHDTLTPLPGPAHPDDATGLSFAQAGIAETGTLVLASGPDNPVTLNYLPATHIVLVRKTDIVATFEEALNLVRARLSTPLLPRTINLISGPSRTADIAGKLVTGAHGPRRLHVIILETTEN